jgi:hypothetical protein
MRHSAQYLSLASGAITIEGALIAPPMLARIAAQTADEQTESDYRIPRGLTLRDEIARYFRVGQALFTDLHATANPSLSKTIAFVEAFARDVLGFADISRVGTRSSADRTFAITLEGSAGRVPIIVVSTGDDLDKPSDHLPSDGRRRSAASEIQDWLNANQTALWGICCNGGQIRLLRDNPSLTRPAYIEADLGQIFENESFADFTTLWLLLHSTRFGDPRGLPSDCAAERWREAGQGEGIAARQRLRDGVEASLLVLGNGFLSNDQSSALRERLRSGALALSDFFEQVLRIVYRLIFLLTTEDRGLLQAPEASAVARKLYAEGYSVSRLRDRAVRRAAWDAHCDAWEGLLIVFAALSKGEPRLGLPALDGLFVANAIPDLQDTRLSNRALMGAIYRLAWLREESGLFQVNWRDMETEELGSVYESLLELTPHLTDDGRGIGFAQGREALGHARKTTGSYYTPDSLVQVLLDDSLDQLLRNLESTSDDPARDLLRVTVLDPACGSGHFLLSAARRIATRLARARHGPTASAQDFREALRDVTRHCIYGVDRNPMAIELAEVALWIETVDPGKPLGFLDANLRCGDSLLGVYDLEKLREGIPDSAYKPVADDNKQAAKVLEDQNRAERDGQGIFNYTDNAETPWSSAPLVLEARELNALPEETPEQLHVKRQRLQVARSSPRQLALRTASDLYLAAFFLPKKPAQPRESGNHNTVPTTRDVWEAARGEDPSSRFGAALALSREVRAFHWPLEFPHIFANGGFDVVIGNPPWERVEMQEREFFAARAPEIASARNTASRKEMIQQLETTDPQLAAEYRLAQRNPQAEVLFLKESARFPFGSAGKVNTYAVFADFFRQTINSHGYAALILPSGLLTGFTYRSFLQHLLKTHTLASFFGFENEDKIFPDVHNETKFGILTIAGTERPVDRPCFTAHIRRPDQIHDPQRRYSLTSDEIESINPNTLNIPAFRWKADAEITAAIHAAAPVLIRKNRDGKIDNPWRVAFRQLFNMATDSGIFIDHEDVALNIIRREDALAILNDGRRVLPLYEGKMFWYFDHRYGTYKGQTEKQANKGVLPHVDAMAHSDPSYRIQPRYWVEAEKVDEALGSARNREWFYAWRDVGPTERTFVGSILPRVGAGHTAPFIIPSGDARSFAALAGILSSLLVDYDARQRSNRMSFFIVEQLAVLGPDALNTDVSYLGTTVRDWLANRVLELCYTNFELAPFARDLGFEQPPFRWQPQRRALIQAEIDALVFSLYRLNRVQVEWIIDSFSVLRKYEEQEHGEFRTRRLVLEVYDGFTHSAESGNVYNTPLSPPLADPSLCHRVSKAPLEPNSVIRRPPATTSIRR